MFNKSELEQTAAALYRFMQPTPQYNWPLLCRDSGADVWVKHENHTPTAAFKVRGGLNLVSRLVAGDDRPKGILSATRGNHGQSLSYAGSKLGLPVTIVVPECNNPDQNRMIESFGAELVIHGEDFEAARAFSLSLQQEKGYMTIPPFDRDLVLGVATYALEFLSCVDDLDSVYVPIGMGSGIAGLIRTRDLLGLKTKIIGVVAEGAPTFSLSFKAGRIVNTDRADTIADGVATRAPMQEAFDTIKTGADHIVVVSDSEIAAAMYQYYQGTHNLAEGAGAVALAGLMQEKVRMKDKKVGVILSGGNIDFASFSRHVAPFSMLDQAPSSSA